MESLARCMGLRGFDRMALALGKVTVNDKNEMRRVEGGLRATIKLTQVLSPASKLSKRI
jgi:hypothetical protein